MKNEQSSGRDIQPKAEDRCETPKRKTRPNLSSAPQLRPKTATMNKKDRAEEVVRVTPVPFLFLFLLLMKTEQQRETKKGERIRSEIRPRRHSLAAHDTSQAAAANAGWATGAFLSVHQSQRCQCCQCSQPASCRRADSCPVMIRARTTLADRPPHPPRLPLHLAPPAPPPRSCGPSRHRQSQPHQSWGS